MDNKLEVRATMAPWYNGVEFLIRQGYSTAEPIVMKERTVGDICNHTFKLGYCEAQTLMDDLWTAGLRPTEGTGSAGSLAATERHLQDMRTLVFSKKE